MLMLHITVHIRQCAGLTSRSFAWLRVQMNCGIELVHWLHVQHFLPRVVMRYKTTYVLVSFFRTITVGFGLSPNQPQCGARACKRVYYS